MRVGAAAWAGVSGTTGRWARVAGNSVAPWDESVGAPPDWRALLCCG